MRRLARGFPGMREVPALEMLNDIREVTQHDLSVLLRPDFMKEGHRLTQGRFTDEEMTDAYLQLHLIADNGGSDNPYWASALDPATQGKNKGKYLLQRIAPDPELEARDDKRSREALAIAMLEDRQLRPVTTNQTFLNDTQEALNRFFSSNELLNNVKLGQSGIRKKYSKKDKEALDKANVQMWDDISGGNDRLSDDYTANQMSVNGHVIPHNKGGSDLLDNLRAQPVGNNSATHDDIGVAGAISALGPAYQSLNERFAGDLFTKRLYNINT